MTQVKEFFDKATSTLTYVVYDEKTLDAVIIDPVLDYDPNSSEYFYDSAKKVLSFIKELGLKPYFILETHAHADHVTGAAYLKKELNLPVGIGKKIDQVQGVFKEIYNFKDLKTDASQFDFLMDEGKTLEAGSLKIETIFTPGHTPACSTYLINNEVAFTGDALFMPDYGTGRCDFPKGDALDLYHSVHEKLYKLPDETLVYPGHDYQPGGRELQFQSSIGEEKKNNIQLKAETSEQEYVKFRAERDKTLKAPRLLLPSLQINIRAGNFPEKEDNGKRYLKLPFSESQS